MILLVLLVVSLAAGASAEMLFATDSPFTSIDRIGRNIYHLIRRNGNLLSITVEDSALSKMNEDEIVRFAEGLDESDEEVTLFNVYRNIDGRAAMLDEVDPPADGDLPEFEGEINDETGGIISKGSKFQYTTKLTYDKNSNGSRKVAQGLKIYKIETCAKGQTKYFENSKTVSWAGSIGGKVYVTFSVGRSVSRTYTSSVTFTGPSESSKNNCRVFYLRFDGYTGTYVQKKNEHNVFTDEFIKSWGQKKGTFKHLISCYDYSTDKKI